MRTSFNILLCLFAFNLLQAQIKPLFFSLKPVLGYTGDKRPDSTHFDPGAGLIPRGYFIKTELSIKNLACTGSFHIRIGPAQNSGEFYSEDLKVVCETSNEIQVHYLVKDDAKATRRATFYNDFVSLNAMVPTTENLGAKWLTVYTSNEQGIDSEKTYYQIK